MSANENYLRLGSVLLAGSGILTGIAIAGCGLVMSNVTVGAGYRVCVGIGLLSLFISLGIGSYGMIKSLLRLGCEQWNVRMVARPFMFQLVLLCIGVLFLAVSPFLIQ